MNPVVLIIDDAHHLHPALYRQLKMLLELHFAARMGLFSLVLIGNDGMRTSMSAVPEQYRRTRFLEVKPLTSAESLGFVEHLASTGEPAIEPAARERIAQSSENLLDLATKTMGLRDEAKEIGEQKVTLQMANAWLASTIQEVIDLTPGSQRQLAKAMGWSESKLTRVKNGDYPNVERERQNLLDRLQAIRAGKDTRDPVPSGVPS